MKRITVLLVDDHPIVREAIRMILAFENDLEVVGEAQDGRQAVALAKALNPDVILMDIAMPYLNGLEATRQIFKAVPAAKVIMLTAYIDDSYVTNAMEAGAVGFLLKRTSAYEVHRGIRAAHQGKMYFSSSISTRWGCFNLQSYCRLGTFARKDADLTSREMEVLQLIAEGNANKQIALELGIGFKTVEKHREHLMKKLDIHDTASLTRYAVDVAIIETSVQFVI